MSRLLLSTLTASALCLAFAGQAQSPINPRLASGAAGNAAELNDPACGPSRNASDGYWAAPAHAGQSRAPLVTGVQKFKVEVVAADIDHPRAIAFLPSGRMLITTRLGGMRTLDKAGKVSAPLANVPAVELPDIALAGGRLVFGEGGAFKVAAPDGRLSDPPQGAPLGKARQVHMSDLRLDRDFAKNRTLYFGYITRDAGGKDVVGRVMKARLSNDERSLEDLMVLHEAADLAPRRIVQGPGRTLFIAAGDSAGAPGYAFQSLKSAQGKVLRINTDGSIPKDNPFAGDPTARAAIYALGFRDVHGMQIDPATGALWTAENGPKGGDELNIVRPGGNYGYPVVSYGRDNGGGPINGGKTAGPGLEQPAYYWTPSIAPSSLAFYTASALPAWRNSLFVGAMSGQQLVRLQLRGGKIVGEEKLLKDRCRRIRDVRQGPDGLLYVLTDETKGEVLRLAPA